MGFVVGMTTGMILAETKSDLVPEVSISEIKNNIEVYSSAFEYSPKKGIVIEGENCDGTLAVLDLE